MKIEAGKSYLGNDGKVYSNARPSLLYHNKWLLDAGIDRWPACFDENGEERVFGVRLIQEATVLMDDQSARHVAEMERVEKPRTTKASLLDAAKAAVADRGLNYGRPEDNFGRIAALWTAHLGNIGLEVVLSPNDVAQMMALMKIARLENDPSHLDSWTDLAGYAACGAEISA